MRYGSIKHGVFGLFAMLLTSSCSLLGPTADTPAPTEYLLQWSPQAGGKPTVELARKCPTLMLNPLHAAAGCTGAGMAYMEEPHRIDYFVRHRWVDCPARMLQPLLNRALETSGLFQGVVSTPTVARFDLQLNTELLRLIQVFESGESRIELSVRFSLLDTHQRSVLFNEVLEITEPTTSGTPYAGVVAANRAVARLMDALQELLRPYAESRCTMTGSHDG